MYIEGSVFPAISGVEIKIKAKSDSRYTLSLRGETALETRTGDDGSFVAGPLYDDTSYEVVASKVCKVFIPVIKISMFVCQFLVSGSHFFILF